MTQPIRLTDFLARRKAALAALQALDDTARAPIIAQAKAAYGEGWDALPGYAKDDLSADAYMTEAGARQRTEP